MPRLLLNRIGRFNISQFKGHLRSLTSIAPKQRPPTDDQSLWVPSSLPDVELLEGITLSEYLRANVKNWGNEPAFECGITGRKYTHNEVYSMGRSFAAALIKSKKFQNGDIIGVVLQNSPEYAAILLGIWDAGLIASPINPAYTNEEITRQLKSSGAKAAITDSEYTQSVLKAKNSKQCPDLDMIIVIGKDNNNIPNGCHSFYEMAKTDYAGIEFCKGSQFDTKEKTCLLPYSSGTTGNPKGVELTNYNLLNNIRQFSAPGITNIRAFEPGYQERFIGLLPMFHIYGMAVFIFVALSKGAHVLTLPKFDPNTFLQSIRKHKPTSLHLVTPLISYIANSKDFGTEELSETHTVVGGAAPIGVTLIRKLMEKARSDFTFQEGYGMTELSPVCHFLTPGAPLDKIGSCGGPVPNTLTKIMDVSTGETLGKNERGEICVKGPQVMKGYYKNEEATRNCLDENGWLRTGDIGYYDDDNYLFIVDRLKELIKVKGMQVAPSELEDALREHPEVSDVAVIGIPNEEWGQLPRASIVPKSKNLKEEDLHTFLKEKLASFKQLRGGIEFVEIIPKAPSGKILRREILQEYKRKNGIE